MPSILDAPPTGSWRRHPAIIWTSRVAYWGLLPFGTFAWGETESGNSAWTRRSL